MALLGIATCAPPTAIAESGDGETSALPGPKGTAAQEEARRARTSRRWQAEITGIPGNRHAQRQLGTPAHTRTHPKFLSCN